jgi:drug/metabolite transporter (DMT)-like permease
MGLIAAAGQGVGLVLSKYGMKDYDSFSASHIRVISGFLSFAILFLVLRKWKELPASFRDTIAMKWLLVGSIFGPFLGVSFSLMAVQHTNAGIAQTIMSLTPVLIIPPAVLLKKEKVTVREIVGAVVAVCGVILFFI